LAAGARPSRTAAKQGSVRLTNGCAWNAVSAFANCGHAVAHVQGSYVPQPDPRTCSKVFLYSIISSAVASSVGGTFKAESAALASALQLALKLVEEAPVSSLRDDPVGARLDDARLPQTQGPEPHGVLGFVLSPPETDLFD
jgi:hypothetical protein